MSIFTKALFTPSVDLPKQWRYHTARTCLRAVAAENLSSTLTYNATIERTALAEILVVSLENLKDDDLITLIESTEAAISACVMSIDVSNSLFRLAFVLLRRANLAKIAASEITSSLIGIFNGVVNRAGGDAFRKRDDVDLVQLVTAILQEILAVPNVELAFGVISTSLLESNVVQCALQCFVQSHKVLVDGEPLYGVLSVTFLLALSQIPAVAEQILADEGLEVIMESTVCEKFCTGDVKYGSIEYKMWTRGILPLLLQFINAIGPSLSEAVRGFLRVYSPQVDRAFANWSRPRIITFGIVEETYFLSIIFASCTPDDANFQAKKSDLLVHLDYLLSHPRYLASLMKPEDQSERISQQLEALRETVEQIE